MNPPDHTVQVDSPKPQANQSKPMADHFFLDPAPDEPENNSRLVLISRKALEMSGLWRQLLSLAFPTQRVDHMNRPIVPLKVDYHKEKQASYPIMPVSYKKVCTKQVLTWITEFCEYHCNDPEWKELNAAYIDDFDEDDLQLEYLRLKEPISFWDWKFISDIAGEPFGDDPNKRANFYDLMIAAHYLNIESLIHIGGKYMSEQLTSFTLQDTGRKLGMTLFEESPVQRMIISQARQSQQQENSL
ncbi:hypothetical protein RDWZM_005058 [Blomia tropicalis]|uniref:Uncharacterized protein n=1 Tax=Blomia tropicalis TaxID=40697 RepID=A0A9Q0RM11_BLOTA|nr:hypothetical protein RDWZM_005058 [Blomia tropicalis]